MGQIGRAMVVKRQAKTNKNELIHKNFNMQ